MTQASFACSGHVPRKGTLLAPARGDPQVSGRGEGVMVRLDPQELVRVDEWAGEQNDRPSRAEALRRLATKMLDLLEPPMTRARRLRTGRGARAFLEPATAAAQRLERISFLWNHCGVIAAKGV
jgi:hypothetical protein